MGVNSAKGERTSALGTEHPVLGVRFSDFHHWTPTRTASPSGWSSTTTTTRGLRTCCAGRRTSGFARSAYEAALKERPKYLVRLRQRALVGRGKVPLPSSSPWG